jgi:hypothetical protein
VRVGGVEVRVRVGVGVRVGGEECVGVVWRVWVLGWRVAVQIDGARGIGFGVPVRV